MEVLGSGLKPFVSDVKQVKFGILSPLEIRRMSVIKQGINNPDCVAGGLMDPRQGALDKTSQCHTCQGSYTDCPGHFAHIELATKLFHIGFLEQTKKILQNVCFFCSRLKVIPTHSKMKAIVDKTEEKPRERFAQVHSLCHGKTICEGVKKDKEDGDVIAKEPPHNGCGRCQPTIRCIGLQLTAVWKKVDRPGQENKIILTPDKVYEIFEKISDDECTILGRDPKFARPEWMILTVLQVPPPVMRPTVVSGSGYTQDDLTIRLAKIVRLNNTLKESSQPANIAENTKRLQLEVASYIDGESSRLQSGTKKSGSQMESVKGRLEGKQGRVRGNLMGKRVDFSARTVITPDPNLRIDQVGIPQSIAATLTIPEIVTSLNMEKLQELVKRDKPTNYPGANFILRSDGKRIDLGSIKDPSDLELKCGYKVERHLLDGDLVVVNRQPTLHKMSMMGHRAKIMPGFTFRLNLSVTTPYNADFDGDEMNIHVPQSLETMAEVEQIHITPRQIITSQSSRPVMGIVQDALCGAFKMTRRDVFLTKEQMQNLLMFLPTWDGKLPQPAIIKPASMWTGKQLFSLIIPGKVNMMQTTSTHPENEQDRWISSGDSQVLIQNGELLMGILCKRSLGASAGSLQHIIFMEQGREVCAGFYGNVQTVVNNWLLYDSISFGISDIMAPDQTLYDIEAIKQTAKDEAEVLIQEAMQGNTEHQSAEKQVNRILNVARDTCGAKARDSFSDLNNFKTMVVAGSKGSTLNISQVIACVGQQNVDGKRIPLGFKNRTLPHFFEGEDGPESRGFIENSFVQGLTPYEFFFHAMAGREGVIDTAVKTSDSGYMQRRLIKLMENLMIQYDGTVRNSCGEVIQFCYGEDGLNPEALENQTLPTVNISDRAFKDKFKLEPTNERFVRRNFRADVAEELMGTAEVHTEIEKEWNQLREDQLALREIFPTGEDRVALPCNLHRMIWNAQKKFNINKRAPTDLRPLRVIEGVRDLLSSCVIVVGEDKFSVEANNNATFLFQCLVRATLCTKRVAEEFHLSTEAFEWLINDIKTRFQQAQAMPGEGVGAIAAESLGEPATQMTLNTFHYAGVSSKNVTLGVPRLNEIINLTKNLNAPSMTIMLTGEAAREEPMARTVLCRLEHTTLDMLTFSPSITNDPDPFQTVFNDDQDLVDAFFQRMHIDMDRISPWLLRFELDRQKMTESRISMEMIKDKVYDAFGQRVICIHGDNKAGKLIVRIREMKKENKQEEEPLADEKSLWFIKKKLLVLTLKGIDPIRKVYLHRTQSNDRVASADTGEFLAVTEWMLETDGSSLMKVLSDLDVDHSRTSTNSICEIANVLGIEAARKSIQIELNKVLRSYDIHVNGHHATLLSDVMTSEGYLTSATRYGLNRQNIGPLMRSSFEETGKILLEASALGELDPLDGVSERIVLGQLPGIGTGCVSLYLNPDACSNAVIYPIPSSTSGASQSHDSSSPNQPSPTG